MRVFFAICFALSLTTVHAQNIAETWKPILSKPGMASYFEGMWEQLGIRVKTYNEAITLIFEGDHFEIKNGIDNERVDYIIDLEPENISNMADYGLDGVIDEHESFKIMAVLFTPFVRASLEHPMMNKSLQMKMAGIEDHVHVYLMGPEKDAHATHTLLFFHKKWLVVEGIHGEAKRVFKMTPQQAIHYQKEAFKAQKSDTRKGWKAFKKFYLGWRKTVSVKV